MNEVHASAIAGQTQAECPVHRRIVVQRRGRIRDREIDLPDLAVPLVGRVVHGCRVRTPGKPVREPRSRLAHRLRARLHANLGRHGTSHVRHLRSVRRNVREVKIDRVRNHDTLVQSVQLRRPNLAPDVPDHLVPRHRRNSQRPSNRTIRGRDISGADYRGLATDGENPRPRVLRCRLSDRRRETVRDREFSAFHRCTPKKRGAEPDRHGSEKDDGHHPHVPSPSSPPPPASRRGHCVMSHCSPPASQRRERRRDALWWFLDVELSASF